LRSSTQTDRHDKSLSRLSYYLKKIDNFPIIKLHEKLTSTRRGLLGRLTVMKNLIVAFSSNLKIFSKKSEMSNFMKSDKYNPMSFTQTHRYDKSIIRFQRLNKHNLEILSNMKFKDNLTSALGVYPRRQI